MSIESQWFVRRYSYTLMRAKHRSRKATSQRSIRRNILSLYVLRLHKLMTKADLTVGQFVYVIRKRIKLSPEKVFLHQLNIDNRQSSYSWMRSCLRLQLWWVLSMKNTKMKMDSYTSHIPARTPLETCFKKCFRSSTWSRLCLRVN